MKNLVHVFVLLAFLCTLPGMYASAQSVDQKSDFLSKTVFRINTSLFNHHFGSLTNNYYSGIQQDLFRKNIPFGVEIDYAITSNMTLNAGISYFGSRISRKSEIFFAFPPSPDAITNFSTTYSFRSFAFEPKVKINFELKDFGFFWSGGPVLSTAFMKTDIDGAPYENPTDFSDYRHFRSNSFALGAQASTGLQRFVTQNVGLSAEIGYRYLNHSSLKTQSGMGSKEPFGYKQNTFFQRVGIIFKF